MKIRINVTDEMIRRLTGSFNPALDESQACNAIQVILRIIERDFNDRSPDAWGMPDDQGRSGNGCIVVEMEEC